MLQKKGIGKSTHKQKYTKAEITKKSKLQKEYKIYN